MSPNSDLSGWGINYLPLGRLGSNAQHGWLFDEVVLGIATQLAELGG